MNRRTTYTLLALATTALAAIAAAASGGQQLPRHAQSRTSGSRSRGSCVRPLGPGNTSGAWSPSSTAL
jgi:hypothetical protein